MDMDKFPQVRTVYVGEIPSFDYIQPAIQAAHEFIEGLGVRDRVLFEEIKIAAIWLPEGASITFTFEPAVGSGLMPVVATYKERPSQLVTVDSPGSSKELAVIRLSENQPLAEQLVVALCKTFLVAVEAESTRAEEWSRSVNELALVLRERAGEVAVEVGEEQAVPAPA